MHRRRSATLSSAKHASAHAVHVSAHEVIVSIASVSAWRSIVAELGWVSRIWLTWWLISLPFIGAFTLRTEPGVETSVWTYG